MIIQPTISIVLVRLRCGSILSVPVVYNSTRRTLWILSHTYKNFTLLYVVKHTWDVNKDMNDLLGPIPTVGTVLQHYEEDQYVKIVDYNYIDNTLEDNVIKHTDGTLNLNNINELLGTDALLVLLIGNGANYALNTIREAIFDGEVRNKPIPRKWLLVENHIMWYSIANKDKKVRLLLNRNKSTVARQLTILKKLLGHYSGAPCRHLQPLARKVDTRCKCSTLDDPLDMCDFCRGYRIDDTLRDYYETQIEELYSSIEEAYVEY